MLRFPHLLLVASGLALTIPVAAKAQDQAPADTVPAPEAPPADEEFLLDEAPAAPAEVAPEITAVLEQMDQVIKALDAKATRTGNSWQFTLEERVMLVVTDTTAARMRIITPIALISDLPEDAMERLMQANFDTALDARYAVAQNLVWGAFLHPLDTLTQRDFAAGILQTHSVGETFGTTFSSGAVSYGGGDSNGIYEQQLKELLEELEKNSTT
ncbi:MAG: hypothetical protein HC870_00395 [Rhizobiales bacterium]|nr:hypothetical protein [Hyphomicrobiales bacterium]